MSLLKLVRDPASNLWAQSKASEILSTIPSQNLIKEAYLFGSAVDGVFTEDLDLDFEIVVEKESDIERLRREVYRPRFADIAIDWVFKTQESFDLRKDLGGVCFEAFHHGIKLR